jgi:hypothetical protein
MPSMRKKSIDNVIVVEVYGPETSENFSCQGGLSGPGHSHDQYQTGLRKMAFAGREPGRTGLDGHVASAR